MQVIVLPFGVLKDHLGATPTPVELREGATVADLLSHLAAGRPALWLRGIAVSINAEYVTAAHVLAEGDEVGLLPPVSGGAPDAPNPEEPAATLSITGQESAPDA